MAASRRCDAVIVGGGHNGLVAAALLARGGRSVVVLERREQVGGAAVSGTPFPGVGARLSRYAYLVSLFPAALIRELGLALELRRRPISSYTPCGDGGLLVDQTAGPQALDPGELDAWRRFYAMVGQVAPRLFPTLTEPLRAREEFRRLVADEDVWRELFDEPLSWLLEKRFTSDLIRGVVLTDAHDRDVRAGGRSADAPEPLLPLPRDRQRDRPLGCPSRRDGRRHRRPPRPRSGRCRDSHSCRVVVDRHRRHDRPGPVRRRSGARVPPRARERRPGRARRAARRAGRPRPRRRARS